MDNGLKMVYVTNAIACAFCVIVCMANGNAQGAAIAVAAVGGWCVAIIERHLREPAHDE